MIHSHLELKSYHVIRIYLLSMVGTPTGNSNAFVEIIRFKSNPVMKTDRRHSRVTNLRQICTYLTHFVRCIYSIPSVIKLRTMTFSSFVLLF